MCQGARTGMRKSYLEVIAAGGIILFNRFRKNNKRIANEDVRCVWIAAHRVLFLPKMSVNQSIKTMSHHAS